MESKIATVKAGKACHGIIELRPGSLFGRKEAGAQERALGRATPELYLEVFTGSEEVGWGRTDRGYCHTKA